MITIRLENCSERFRKVLNRSSGLLKPVFKALLKTLRSKTWL
ncbi:MAG: hypothetical protein QXO47_02475 [Thermoproteota archaeon]